MFALEGIDWRSWSAADRAAAVYVLLVRNLKDEDKRNLFELIEDKESVARIDNAALGHSGGVEVTDVGVRRGVR